MLDLNIPENMRRFRKLRSTWRDISKETLLEVIEVKRCKNCLGRLIVTQRKGMDVCKCNKDIYKNTEAMIDAETHCKPRREESD